MISQQTLKGNLINQDYSTAFTLNQGDKGVPFKVELLENGTPYTLQSTDIVTIEWLKSNGNPFLQEGDISYGTTYIEFTTPESVAQYSGSGTFNIIITNNNVRKGTIRREYKVVPTSMKPGSISEDVITDAITELRNLNTELAETVQNNQEIINSNSAATKTDIANVNSSLEEKAKYITSKINALHVGFKNDGTTDNISALATFRTLFSNSTLYFPNGTYCFEGALDFEGDMCLELERGAELKCTASTTIENFITLNKDKASGYTFKDFIKGGTINGNFKCNNLVALSMFRLCTLEECTLKNFNEKGLVTRYQGGTGGELMANKLLIQNEELKLGSYGIYDNGHDNIFTDIIIQDVETCIYTMSSQFTNVHGWVYFSGLLETSTYCELNSSNSSFTNCCMDTIRYGFKRNNDEDGALITNFTILFNTNVWTSDIAFSPLIFGGDDNSKYNVSNITINLLVDCIFAENKTMNRSRFDHVIINRRSGKTLTNLIETNYAKLIPEMYTTDADKCVAYGNITTNSEWTNLPESGYGVLSIFPSYDWILQMYKVKDSDRLYIRVGKPDVWERWFMLEGYKKEKTQTYSEIQSMISNETIYDSVRFLIPLEHALDRTIELTEVKAMKGNTTTDITSSCEIVGIYINGFAIKCTDTSVAGGVAICSFTVTT